MLCGIYSSAHLIACFKVKAAGARGCVELIASAEKHREFYEEAVEAAFYALMKSLEANKLLTAKRLCESRPKKGGGFDDKTLEKVFNALDEDDREGLCALAFCRAKVKKLRGSQKRKILAAGACAIVNQSGENHWITVEGKHPDGGYWSFDPSRDDPKQSIPQVGWSKGLFIGKPEVLEV